MTGGVNKPPVEATASMAAATIGRYPTFFIRGMVKVPIVATLAGGEPVIAPMQALPKIAALAGPPRKRPAIA
jgi:hypothetical protein